MASWNKVMNDIADRSQKGDTAALDTVRREAIGALRDIRGRNVICYYSGWLEDRLDPAVMNNGHYCRDMYQRMVEAFNDRTEDRGDELSQYAERISEASDEIAAVDRDALPDYLASGYVWLKGAAENYSRAADALVEAHSLNAQGKVTEANDKVHDADFSADAALDGIAKARDHFESELMGEF